MLEVVTVPVSTGTVDCWMDIQRGHFPNVSTQRLCLSSVARFSWCGCAQKLTGTNGQVLSPRPPYSCISTTSFALGFSSVAKMEAAGSIEMLPATKYAILKRELPQYSNIHNHDFRYVILGRYLASGVPNPRHTAVSCEKCILQFTTRLVCTIKIDTA
jgi:hypothetical protein